MARDTQGSPADEKKLEQYGVWVKVKPRDVATAPVLEESFGLSDLESPRASARTRTAAGESALTAEEEELLDELETELEPAAETAGIAVPNEEPLEVTLSESAEAADRFDDLAALENELASVSTTTSTGSTSSAEILARIEDELRSIRSDLNRLRHDLSGLRKSAAEGGGEGPSAQAGSQSAFFDQEDEAIALTGDELDNILNTAEITEEAAEAPAVGADIPDFDIPAPEPVEAPALAGDLDLVEEAEPADDTLVLTGEDLLPTGMPGDSAVAMAEDLPDDLVLEELGDDDTKKDSTDMPEIDLEEIPEMESEAAPASRVSSPSIDEGSETIDLETLDLGEEPKVVDAVPEQVDEVEDLEEVTEPDDAQAAKAPGTRTEGRPDEVDLEALAAEAEELEDDVPVAPVVEDLEIGELETLTDEAGVVPPQKEIEIDFERDLAEDLGPSPASRKAAAASPDEDVTDAEEVFSSSGSEAAGGVPDNLKDEIRTVLKYMDHLLEALPDEKIQEFASSNYFVMYKKLFEDLGLGE